MFVKFFTRWSIIVPVFIYVCFLFIIITISFPLKSVNNNTIHIDKTTLKLGNIPLADKSFEIVKAVVWNEKVNESSTDNNEQNPKTILRDIFKVADLNKDSLLNVQELAKYINARVRQHIDMAIRGNTGMFAQVDKSPRDGLVTWEEYHAFFLKGHGFTDTYVNNHNENKHSGLQRNVKEAIMRDKAMWAEAARNDPYSLTLDEFLAFKHPESSAANMLAIVDDLFEKFDRDGDEFLTQDEFATLPDTESESFLVDIDEADIKMIKQGEQERRKEFTHLVDKNKDGKADRMELLAYVDPRHPRHSLQEAATLMNLADTNKDSNLSIEEILNKMDLFLGSKMVDTANSFHDDF